MRDVSYSVRYISLRYATCWIGTAREAHQRRAAKELRLGGLLGGPLSVCRFGGNVYPQAPAVNAAPITSKKGRVWVGRWSARSIAAAKSDFAIHRGSSG